MLDMFDSIIDMLPLGNPKCGGVQLKQTNTLAAP